jgi:hypothetical protein
MIIELENHARYAKKGELVLRSRTGRPIEISPAHKDYNFPCVIVRRILATHEPGDRPFSSGAEIGLYDDQESEANDPGKKH